MKPWLASHWPLDWLPCWPELVEIRVGRAEVCYIYRYCGRTLRVCYERGGSKPGGVAEGGVVHDNS